MPLPEAVLSQIPEDIRNDPSLATFNDLGGFAKSYVETKKLVGSSIRPPGPDATPEAKKEFVEKMLKHDPDLVHFGDEAAIYKRLGKPEKPEDYEVPEEAKAAGLDEKEVRALAAAAGLTKSQAKALALIMAQGSAAQKKAATDALAALKQEWGAATDEKSAAARTAAVKMGLTEDEAKALSPRALRAFANVAAAVGGADPLRKNEGGAGPAKLTPTEAKLQLAEIRGNPAYWNSNVNALLHESLKAKVAELTPMAFPEP